MPCVTDDAGYLKIVGSSTFHVDLHDKGGARSSAFSFITFFGAAPVFMVYFESFKGITATIGAFSSQKLEDLFSHIPSILTHVGISLFFIPMVPLSGVFIVFGTSLG